MHRAPKRRHDTPPKRASACSEPCAEQGAEQCRTSQHRASLCTRSGFSKTPAPGPGPTRNLHGLCEHCEGPGPPASRPEAAPAEATPVSESFAPASPAGEELEDAVPQLPECLWWNVFRFLDNVDKAAAGRVCRSFRRAVNDKELWPELYLRVKGGQPGDEVWLPDKYASPDELEDGCLRWLDFPAACAVLRQPRFSALQNLCLWVSGDVGALSDAGVPCRTDFGSLLLPVGRSLRRLRIEVVGPFVMSPPILGRIAVACPTLTSLVVPQYSVQAASEFAEALAASFGSLVEFGRTGQPNMHALLRDVELSAAARLPSLRFLHSAFLSSAEEAQVLAGTAVRVWDLCVGRLPAYEAAIEPLSALLPRRVAQLHLCVPHNVPASLIDALLPRLRALRALQLAVEARGLREDGALGELLRQCPSLEALALRVDHTIRRRGEIGDAFLPVTAPPPCPPPRSARGGAARRPREDAHRAGAAGLSAAGIAAGVAGLGRLRSLLLRVPGVDLAAARAALRPRPAPLPALDVGEAAPTPARPRGSSASPGRRPPEWGRGAREGPAEAGVRCCVTTAFAPAGRRLPLDALAACEPAPEDGGLAGGPGPGVWLAPHRDPEAGAARHRAPCPIVTWMA